MRTCQTVLVVSVCLNMTSCGDQEAKPGKPTELAAKPDVPTQRPTPAMTAEEAKAAQTQAEKQAGLPMTFANSIGMKMVYIKPGAFMMGSRDSAEDVARKGESKAEYHTPEHPQHRVTITEGFFMSAYEVTQEQYEKVMGANPAQFEKGGDYPVETVSWETAVAFCKKLSEMDPQRSYRLPTEAEWEYACRAGTTTPFHFGETISTDQANYDGDYTYGSGSKGEDRECTTPVGTFKPNAWGLYDMHGNVYEWCQDWYGEDYYAKSPENDPTGPSSGSSRVLRGGSWCNGPQYCRSASRFGTPGFRVNIGIGFRVVCASFPAR